MDKLHLQANNDNSKIYFYLSSEKLSDEEIVNNIHLIVDLSSKEVNGVHDFFHKIIITKILGSDYNPISKVDLLKSDNIEEELIKLKLFLFEQVDLVNGLLNEYNDKGDIAKNE